MRWSEFARIAALSAVALPGTGFAGSVTVVYTEISTHSSGTVPGALDASGLPVATNWLAIEDMNVRHDGGQWCIKGRTTQATTNDSILVLGSGTSGTMFCQDGQPFQGGVAPELYDFFDPGLPVTWDSAGNIGFSCRAKGGVAAVFEKVVIFDGTNHVIVHQMGDSFPGLSDLLPNPSGDETFGNSIGSVTLQDGGTFLFGNTPITNCHSSRYPAVFRGASAFQQSGVTQITVLTGVLETWDNFLFDGGGGTPDGAHWYWEGDTENASTAIDGIFVVDGVCIFQEGQPLLATGLTYADTFAARMLSDGTWFARGDDSLDNDWAVQNGAIIALTGDSITTGSTEKWGVSFTALAGNKVGDWVLAGSTDSVDLNADNVLVQNGQHVLCREGDPVDLDGNGSFDDDVFIASFQPNDLHVSDNGDVWFLATLRNGALAALGDAFLRTRLCGTSAAYGAGCPGSGGFVPQLALDGCPKAGGAVTLSVAQGLGGTTAILFFGFGQTSTPMQNGCTLLVSPLPLVLALPLGGSGAGQGSISVPAVIPANALPVTFDMQVFTQDAGVFQGYANSNGVEVEVN